MSAARLNLIWDEPVKIENVPFELLPVRECLWVRPITPAKPAARCPECNSIIYSRRHRLCGVCNEPLPDDLLFSLTEAQQVEDLLRTEQTRHRRWMEQRKEAETY